MRTLLAATLLFAHARRYDVLCDDAFVSLRYARNLAEGNGLVYNAGERVEGFTSLLWVLLEALLLRLGAGPRAVVDVLGFATALACALVVERGAERLELRPVGRLVAHAALVSSVSFAVWLLAGLEASAYGVLVLATLVAADEAISSVSRSWHAAVVAGLVAAAAMLVRPETPLVASCAAVAALVVARERAVIPILRAGVTFGVVVGPLLLARRFYFGDWLPNTFDLKTTGDGAALLAQGQRYVGYAVKHHGALVGLALAGALVLMRRPRTRGFALAAVAFVPLYGLVVARVGGDFLPATRLFAPLVPLLALLAGFVVQELGRSVPASLPGPMHGGVRGVVAGVAASLLMAPQLEWSRTVGVDHEPEEQALHVEPLRRTRLDALRRCALGRWIGAHAKAGDGMAMGAAGAAPYYAGSGVANLDVVFGRGERDVTREGRVDGGLSGHPRRSPLAYTLSKRPVFLFEGDYDSEVTPALPRDTTWESRGYTWAAARVDAVRYDAPSTFWWVFLLRRDRADELRGATDVVLAADELNRR